MRHNRHRNRKVRSRIARRLVGHNHNGAKRVIGWRSVLWEIYSGFSDAVDATVRDAYFGREYFSDDISNGHSSMEAFASALAFRNDANALRSSACSWSVLPRCVRGNAAATIRYLSNFDTALAARTGAEVAIRLDLPVGIQSTSRVKWGLVTNITPHV